MLVAAAPGRSGLRLADAPGMAARELVAAEPSPESSRAAVVLDQPH